MMIDARRRLGARGRRARRPPRRALRALRPRRARPTRRTTRRCWPRSTRSAIRRRPAGFRARFRCVLALVDPFTGEGAARTVEGACEGRITRTPRGSGGFGYDPLFVVGGTEKTMAELGEDEKNRISHRGRAFAGLRPLLEAVLAERAEQVEVTCR